MNIIVTGSLGYDYIMDFSGRFADRIMADKIHKVSLSFLADTFHRNFGGTSVNIAYSLKLLGMDPFILSSAGNDFSPYKEHLKNHDITTKFISEYKDESTGTYFCVTDQEDNQIGAFYAGATKYAKELSIKSVRNSPQPPLSQRGGVHGIPPLWERGGQEGFLLNGYFVVLAPTDSRAMVKYFKECIELNLSYLFDPAFQIGDFSKEELFQGIKHAEILIGNDYEISLIEKKLNISHEHLIKLLPIVITTLGSKGSVIEGRHSVIPAEEPGSQLKKIPHQVRDDTIIRIKISPAKPKNTSDPTGAGDAYRAGFLAGYLRGFDLKTSGQMGSVAAAYTVETYGTQTHEFTINKFEKRYRVNFGEELSLSSLA